MPINDSSLRSSPLDLTVDPDPDPRRQRSRLLDVMGEMFALALHHVQDAPLPLEELALVCRNAKSVG